MRSLALFCVLALAWPVQATEIHGRAALGWTSLFLGGSDPTLRLFGRLRLELKDLFGNRGGMSLDLEARRSNGGLSRDPLGVRELRISYELLPSRLDVRLGRVSMAELEGLQVDGGALRLRLARVLTLEVAGGMRQDLATPDGQPTTQRPGFGAMLRAEGKTGSALLGFSELRSDGSLERRIVSGSGYARLGEALSVGGHAAVDLGQPGHGAKVTSLYAHATFRQGRVFDLGASFGLSSPLFLDPRPEQDSLVDLPEELRPQPLPPEQRFGPQSLSLSLRGQVSPFSLLSVYGAARFDRREDEEGGARQFLLGTRLRLTRLDTTRLRTEVSRWSRPGLDGIDVERWRWKAVAAQRLTGSLEVEAGVAQTLQEKLQGEATLTWFLNRHVSLFTYYSLAPDPAGDLHVMSGQLAYRF